MHPNVKQLTGRRFGRLRVVGVDESKRSPYGNTYWKCACDCGGEKSVLSGNLKNGSTVSCGCFRRERASTHRKSKTTEFVVWVNMLSRCYDPKNKRYDRYGGRGISVCDRWRESFQSFFDDMGLSNGLQLDRENNDGNYELVNCRWITQIRNANNKSSNFKVAINGVTMTLAEWSRESGIKATTIRKRVMSGYVGGDIISATDFRRAT